MLINDQQFQRFLVTSSWNKVEKGLIPVLEHVAKQGSVNPQVESKIRAELKSTMPAEERENWRLFSTQELSNLVYLHGALCETLRLYPPVPFQHKEPLKSDVLPSGHRVGPNMMVLFSVYVMGRMTSIWGPDCLEFKPERSVFQGNGSEI
ncbi:hypothetical protein D5086_015103 [Populus alba]|uniref:Uncharacterized protein n=1 Tax=Populus alba TaxID=43335 RepID=A0ACC4C008_POPAL